MTRRHFNSNNGVAVAAGTARASASASAALAVAFALAGPAASSTSVPSTASSNSSNYAAAVTLQFLDSAMVNDTLIRLGDIAAVECADAALAGQVRALAAGEAAPAGYSRFINSEDLLTFSVRPRFKGVNIVSKNAKRVKVVSDYQQRTIGEFEGEIRSYLAERLGWGAGECSLTVSNPQVSWKSGRGPVDVEISGVGNPFAKGNTSLTLTARQGSRVSRVPVLCRITVRAPVLVASRQIQRGEEITPDNSRTEVVDITNFAYAPMRELPKAGTATVFRTVSAGNVLHDRMLRAIPVVARGDRVRINFVGERIKVSVLGVARDSGGSGDRIWVENLQTGKLIRAAVSGKGSVVVHQEGDRS